MASDLEQRINELKRQCNLEEEQIDWKAVRGIYMFLDYAAKTPDERESALAVKAAHDKHSLCLAAGSVETAFRRIGVDGWPIGKRT